MADIGFVGLGAMGRHMARNLAGAGHQVTAYNRTRDRAMALADVLSVASSVADVACDRTLVVTMLADDAALEEVSFGRPDASGHLTPGLLAGMPEGGVHVSMSTISPALSRRLTAAHRAAGQSFVAAPVFGRPEAAEAGKLWVVAAGAEEDLARCTPVFDAVGAGATLVGDEPWQANVVKLAGNFTIASMIETLGEAYALVRRAGVEPRSFLEVINGALYKSPLYQNYGTLIADERYSPAGFKLELGLKDVRLAQALADQLQVPMPLAGLLHDHMLSLVARGHGADDWSSFARVSADRAGLEKRHA
jgi:3-hydroxyisobutyrate dehydrogenase-like beta-hydroxyacid dehydrogenase